MSGGTKDQLIDKIISVQLQISKQSNSINFAIDLGIAWYNLSFETLLSRMTTKFYNMGN